MDSKTFKDLQRHGNIWQHANDRILPNPKAPKSWRSRFFAASSSFSFVNSAWLVSLFLRACEDVRAQFTINANLVMSDFYWFLVSLAHRLRQLCLGSLQLFCALGQLLLQFCLIEALWVSESQRWISMNFWHKKIETCFSLLHMFLRFFLFKTLISRSFTDARERVGNGSNQTTAVRWLVLPPWCCC